jgi:probable 2-oxoglutarate dehydrogenase E1 component DHKTD1
MPHRGRLNLLSGLLQYPKDNLFWKILGNSEIPPGLEGIGDVFSHLGTKI